MGNFVGNTVSSGSIIYAADHNELVNRIAAVVNGGLDDNNIAGVSGSKLNDASVTAVKLDTSVNPNTLLGETIKAFVQTGCVWSSVSGLNGAMTAGVIYVGPSGIIYRFSISSVSSHSFTASKDTYIDVDSTGTIGYQEVSNGSASPSLAANSIRLAIVITDGSTITSINQGSTAATAPVVSSNVLTVTDSLGNLICPHDPAHQTLGYRRITAQFDAGTNVVTDVAGLACPIVAPGNRQVRISLVGSALQSGTGRSVYGHIRESSTDLNIGYGYSYASGKPDDVSTSAVITPGAGLHTYKISIECESGGNVSMHDGYILVELV